MALDGMIGKVLDGKFWGMAFTAALAALVCAIIGQKIDGKFPGARFLPGVVLVVIGLTMPKEGKAGGYGLALALGASVDLGVATVQKTPIRAWIAAASK